MTEETQAQRLKHLKTLSQRLAGNPFIPAEGEAAIKYLCDALENQEKRLHNIEKLMEIEARVKKLERGNNGENRA